MFALIVGYSFMLGDQEPKAMPKAQVVMKQGMVCKNGVCSPAPKARKSLGFKGLLKRR